MLNSGQWIAAQDLRSGLRLKTLNGTVGIKSIAIRAAPFVGKVYDLLGTMMKMRYTKTCRGNGGRARVQGKIVLSRE
jgi:hypothetical protein